MTAITRAALISVLRAALESDAAVDAAWEGGSAAFDRDDAWSDVDAVAVVDGDAVDATFARVERALGALSPIVRRYHVPATAGYVQRFYRLRDAGEFLVVDLALIRRGDPVPFFEAELHGRARVWFDRRGIALERHLDRDADLAAARARVPVLADGFEMLQHVVTKERLRGHAIDALVFYQQLTVRPLVEALRLLHAPETRIFGPRYLRRDLPGAICDRLEPLLYVRDLEDLARRHDEARAWFARCIDRLQAHGPGCGVAEPAPGPGP
jgi:hypothetical protein